MNPIAFVFMIIAIVILVAAALYFGIGLLTGSNVSAATQDVMTIVGNAQQIFGVQGDYAGISGNATSVIPAGMQTSTPLGGTFTVASGSAGLPSSEFEVEMNGLTLNAKACEKLIVQVDDIGTTVNGTAVGNVNAAPTGAQAAAACSGGATAVAFQFGNNQ
ncbi:type 4 pilus major pilin [Acidithiobacillus sp. IBUN Pt1247-S3]|uniref:type 4 pilus major pilin n=1 Tax=Acidithiobacillus sp. IBUN Pt1247-S3 TaxID=3166642 RepID=UPI0034E5CEDF